MSGIYMVYTKHILKIGVPDDFKQFYRLCEQRFVRTMDLQKRFSLSEAVNDGSGKEMVWVPKI